MSPLHRRYDGIVLLRAHPGFRVLAARRQPDRARVVLVAPGRFVEPTLTRQAMERALYAHERIDHPAVPRARGIHEIDGRPILELECPAIADGLEFARRVSLGTVRLPYEAADAYIVGIRLGLEAAHAVIDPRTEGPTCIGRLSSANVLFADDGRWFVFGFGHNVAIVDEHGMPDPTIPHFAAPEVMLGHPATPEGDYVALLQLMRAGIPMVDKSDALGRILKAITTSSDKVLVELVQWFDQRVIGEKPKARPTIAEAVAKSDRIRAILGVKLDPRGMAAIAAKILADPEMDSPPLVPHGTAVLSLGPEGQWARFGEGDAIRLRGPMRRMLVALAEKQQMGFPSPMRAADLIDVGWPDESTTHESALNRVYVTINRLKKALPDGVIERFDDGYRLRPDVMVRRSTTV